MLQYGLVVGPTIADLSCVTVWSEEEGPGGGGDDDAAGGGWPHWPQEEDARRARSGGQR